MAHLADQGLKRLAAAIFLLSASTLLFQLGQTRLFSAALGYHLTFLAISVALLGVAAGATAGALWDAGQRRPSGALLALFAGGSVLVALAVETRVDPVAHSLVAAVGAAYVVGSLPFVFTSWLIVRALRAFPGAAGRLYAADLAGAGLGGLLGYAAITPLSLQGLYGVAAAIAFAAALLLMPDARSATRRLAQGLALLVSAAVVIVLASFGEVLAPPVASANKPIVAELARGAVRDAVRWDPMARVDVLRFDHGGSGATEAGQPDAAASAVPELFMRLDQDAATPIVSPAASYFEGMTDFDPEILAAPYVLLDRPAVLVIGPGGGIDIVTALNHGAPRVVGVEANRAVADLMRTRYSEYSGGLYLDPRVAVAEDEARSFVRRSDDRYDLLAMTVVDSWAALASGSYALTESYLYTEEAFADYLGHLAPGGMLSIGRWYREPPVEMLRTVEVAAAGLRRRGGSDPAAHMVVLRDRLFGLLLVSERPLGAAEVSRLREFAERRGFEVAYDPLRPGAPFAPVLSSRAESAPSTDDRPFFFDSVPLPAILSGTAALPTGYGVLVVGLLLAVSLSYGVVLAPLRWRTRGLPPQALLRTAGYATALGFGFIFAELVLLQRLTLYLGQPTLALALGLAALLGGAACGSALVSRFAGGVRLAAGASAVGVITVLSVIPWITDATISWPLWGRAATAALAGAVLGLPLGSVFPRLVASVGREDPRLVSWAWAMNGSASVVGSIVAIAVAMNVGFSGLGWAAVGCYMAAALPIRRHSARESFTEPSLATDAA